MDQFAILHTTAYLMVIHVHVKVMIPFFQKYELWGLTVNKYEPLAAWRTVNDLPFIFKRPNLSFNNVMTGFMELARASPKAGCASTSPLT